MPRRPQKIFKRREVPNNILRFLKDEHPNPSGDWEIFVLQDTEIRNLWDESKDEIMAKWISKHPGSRPSLWWKFDSPRQPDHGSGFWYEGTLPEPRRRISGKGKLHPGYVPSFQKGIPTYWDDKTLYPSDPLVFESQAAYLERHGLLTESEKKYLEKHIDLMEPERVNCEL